ncbi:hypothetical protein HGM15179_002542, partial [Zosterops borbonicus]
PILDGSRMDPQLPEPISDGGSDSGDNVFKGIELYDFSQRKEREYVRATTLLTPRAMLLAGTPQHDEASPTSEEEVPSCWRRPETSQPGVWLLQIAGIGIMGHSLSELSATAGASQPFEDWCQQQEECARQGLLIKQTGSRPMAATVAQSNKQQSKSLSTWQLLGRTGVCLLEEDGGWRMKSWLLQVLVVSLLDNLLHPLATFIIHAAGVLKKGVNPGHPVLQVNVTSSHELECMDEQLLVLDAIAELLGVHRPVQASPRAASKKFLSMALGYSKVHNPVSCQPLEFSN